MWLWNKTFIHCIYGVFLGSFDTFDVASKRIVSSNMTLFISNSIQIYITVKDSLVEES